MTLPHKVVVTVIQEVPNARLLLVDNVFYSVWCEPGCGIRRATPLKVRSPPYAVRTRLQKWKLVQKNTRIAGGVPCTVRLREKYEVFSLDP